MIGVKAKTAGVCTGMLQIIDQTRRDIVIGAWGMFSRRFHLSRHGSQIVLYSDAHGHAFISDRRRRHWINFRLETLSGAAKRSAFAVPRFPNFCTSPKTEKVSFEESLLLNSNHSQVKPSLRLFHFQVRDHNVALAIFPSCCSPSSKVCHHLRPPQRHLDTPKPPIHHPNITLCPPHRPLIIIPNTASLSPHCHRQ